MWFEDGGTDKNTGRRAGSGKVEHVKLFIGSDQDGHQVIKSGDKVEMVRTCEEEMLKMKLLSGRRKVRPQRRFMFEGGHAGCWCDRRG